MNTTISITSAHRNRYRWFNRTCLFSVVGTAILGSACASETEIGEQTSAVQQAPVYPLDRADPAAQLPKELQDALHQPQPEYPGKMVPKRPGKKPSIPYVYDGATQTETQLELPDLNPEIRILPGVNSTLPTNDQHPTANGIASKRDDFVIGSDDRVFVSNTTTREARPNVKIFAHYTNGGEPGTSLCSGVLIGNHEVLTAAHCLYDPKRNAYATSVEVVPALDDNYMPFGIVHATKWGVPGDWKDNADSEYDMGHIVLAKDIGSITGTYSVLNEPESDLEQESVYMYGYPGDLPGIMPQYGETTFNPDVRQGLKMVLATGNICDVDDKLIDHKADTYFGQSGAGMLSTRYKDLGLFVYGVNVAQKETWFSKYNISVRIDSEKFQMLAAWKNANQAQGGPLVTTQPGWNKMTGGPHRRLTVLPSTYYYGNGLVSVGDDGKVYLRHRNSAGVWSSDWDTIGENVSNAYRISAVARQGLLLDLAAVSQQGHVITKRLKGWFWSPNKTDWEDLGVPKPGCKVVAQPTLVSWSADRIDMLAVCDDGSVHHNWYNSQSDHWGTWGSLGGDVIGPVAGIALAQGKLVFAARDRKTGVVVMRHWDESTWSWYPALNQPWRSLSTSGVAGPPVIAALNTNEIHVLAVDFNGDLNQSRINPISGQTAWSMLGTNMDPNISISSSAVRNQIYVAGMTNNGQGVIQTWDNNSGWLGWVSLGGNLVDPPTLANEKLLSTSFLVAARGQVADAWTKFYNGSYWVSN
jgi:V8-like Glu-specific endopeptidase